MASKYVQEMKVPDGFQELLRDFAREVLRAQPEDIHEFGANYFEHLREYGVPPPQVYASVPVPSTDDAPADAEAQQQS